MRRRTTAKDRGAAERERLQDYRMLVEQMQEGIAILLMRPLRIVFANRSLAEMTGYRPRALTSLTPAETARRIHPSDRSAVLGYMRKRLRGENVHPLCACRLVRKDGTVLHTEFSSRRIRHGGKPAVQATFIDRTRRRATEERLNLLSRVVDQVAEGVAVVAMDGRIVYANRAFSAMHGYGIRSLLGRHLSVFHSPAQLPAVRAALARSRAAGGFSGEIWHARRDGTVFPTLMQTTLLRDEGGTAIGMVGTCRDITDLRKAADELARSKEEKTLILDSVEEAITYKDRRMRIVWGNWAAARRAGVTPRDLVGKRCHVVLHGLSRACPNCPCRLAMRTGEASWGEVAGRNGRRFIIGAYPVKGAAGRITGTVEVSLETGGRGGSAEMDTLRSFSKMLIDLQEEERRHIALELHDHVGQALTATKLYLQQIERECARSGYGVMCKFADAIALIDDAIGDVRSISHRLRPPSLDILGLVPSLKQLAESLAARAGVAIAFSARGIRGGMDARVEIALYRVLQEALNNALKYSGCTRIGVSLRGGGGSMALRVEDNGRGFDPTRQKGMSGLGITGMRERIEGVGGLFAVRSGPGEGATVDAVVPLPAAARRTHRRGGEP